MESTKQCGRCNLIKSVNEFNHRSAGSDGYQSRCKLCNVEVNQIWLNNNRDRFNEQNRNKYATNPQCQINKICIED